MVLKHSEGVTQSHERRLWSSLLADRVWQGHVCPRMSKWPGIHVCIDPPKSLITAFSVLSTQLIREDCFDQKNLWQLIMTNTFRGWRWNGSIFKWFVNLPCYWLILHSLRNSLAVAYERRLKRKGWGPFPTHLSLELSCRQAGQFEENWEMGRKRGSVGGMTYPWHFWNPANVSCLWGCYLTASQVGCCGITKSLITGKSSASDWLQHFVFYRMHNPQNTSLI